MRINTWSFQVWSARPGTGRTALPEAKQQGAASLSRAEGGENREAHGPRRGAGAEQRRQDGLSNANPIVAKMETNAERNFAHPGGAQQRAELCLLS